MSTLALNLRCGRQSGYKITIEPKSAQCQPTSGDTIAGRVTDAHARYAHLIGKEYSFVVEHTEHGQIGVAFANNQLSL